MAVVQFSEDTSTTGKLYRPDLYDAYIPHVTARCSVARPPMPVVMAPLSIMLSFKEGQQIAPPLPPRVQPFPGTPCPFQETGRQEGLSVLARGDRVPGWDVGLLGLMSLVVSIEVFFCL